MVDHATEKEILWIANMNPMKLVSTIFKLSLHALFISFRPQKRAKMIRIMMPFPILSTFPLLSNSFSYSGNKLHRKYSPFPDRHISLLKMAFEKCKPVSLLSRFCGTLLQSFCRFNQSLLLRNFYNIALNE